MIGFAAVVITLTSESKHILTASLNLLQRLLLLRMLCRPLHDAVDSDCIETVRLLLAAGADINLTTYSGKTAESLACSHDMRAFLHGDLLTCVSLFLIQPVFLYFC